MNAFERGITPADRHEGPNFVRAAMEQLDSHMVDVTEAKMALLTAIVMGGNIALVGEPGTGKTMLGNASTSLIEGVGPHNTFRAPANTDVRPEQIIGTEIVTNRRVTTQAGDGFGPTDTNLETTEIDIDPMLHPGTLVMFNNEFNRISPDVRTAMLEAIHDGTIDRAGKQILLNLLFGVATLNPHTRTDGVKPVNAAEASRHPIGFAMGNEREQDARIAHLKKMRNWQPKPVTPVRDIDTVLAIQARANSPDEVVFPELLYDKVFVPTVVSTQGALENRGGVFEGDERIIPQLTRIARARAVMGGEEVIAEEHIQEAVKLLIGARIGMLTTKDTRVIRDRVDEAVDEALDVTRN